MATFVNAPITFRLTAGEGNNGRLYDYRLDTSLNSYQASWRAASTPIYNELSARSAFLPAVHWHISIHNRGYSTPNVMPPYNHVMHLARVNGTCGKVEINKGLQAFSDLIIADFESARVLATPVV